VPRQCLPPPGAMLSSSNRRCASTRTSGIISMIFSKAEAKTGIVGSVCRAYRRIREKLPALPGCSGNREKDRQNFFTISDMPKKIKELVGALENAGFINRAGKGSHRNFIHPALVKPVVISGNLGDDAKKYQEQAVQAAIEDAKR